ncbi:MAG: UUP1 family membrane protein [Spirochaetaceae bacterium]|nr:UUP1 family membrane protein [Spirochaetaceae bacterium]
MDRAIVVCGAIVAAIGGAVFLWKVWGLGLPITPSEDSVVWLVQLEIAARGSERGSGSIRIALPRDDARQRIFGEHFSSDGLQLETRKNELGERTGLWSGRIDEVDHVGYRFHVQLFPTDRTRRTPPLRSGADAEAVIDRARYTRSERRFPITSEPVAALLEELPLESGDGDGEWARTLYAFVRYEIASAASAPDDALLTLTQRSGSESGRARLLVTLLRAVGIPARVVRGLELDEQRPAHRVWVEAWLDEAWRPMSTGEGRFGSVPDRFVRFSTADESIVRSTGTAALDWTYSVARRRLAREEVESLMMPTSPLFRSASLYRLPVQVQGMLRLLLLFCAATLVVSVFRVVVGVPSFGTFMPALLALAMRETGLAYGVLLVVLVVAVGLVGRLLLERLRLLFVPRVGILVCLVVLSAAALGLVGESFQTAGLFGGIVLPIVIVTMMIERVAIVLAEDGARTAVVRALCSALIALAVFPVLRSESLGHLLFAFPELLLVIIGVQIWLGGYTGFRLLELVRFQALRRVGASG